MTEPKTLHCRMIEFWNHDSNFITSLASSFSSQSGTFLTEDFFRSLSTIYFLNHSGDKTSSSYLDRIISITSAIYTSDGYQVYDSDGNPIVISLDDFNAKVAHDLIYRYGSKWRSMDTLYTKDFDAFQSESIQETETPDITKESTKTKSQNISVSEGGSSQSDSTPSGTFSVSTDGTNGVSAFNESGFQDDSNTHSSSTTSYDKYVVHNEGKNENTRTTTASADDNKETESSTEKGTRTRTITHLGGNDVWTRIESYKAFLADTLMDIIMKDLDAMLCIPYYCY